MLKTDYFIIILIILNLLLLFKYLFICLTLLGSSLPCAGSLAAARGIQFPDQGLNLGPLHLKQRVLTTGSSREVPRQTFLFFFFFPPKTDCFKHKDI